MSLKSIKTEGLGMTLELKRTTYLPWL